MCDTLCAVRAGGTLFAKNSDRPSDEGQVAELFDRRSAGGTLRTQYLEIADEGACRVLGSRPLWLWGFEHGLNEHRVAIGNEAVYTTGHTPRGRDGLIGMDLVRLGLERGTTAAEAVSVIGALLAEHGQGGDCYAAGGSYDSSFLVADPDEAWIVETSGRESHAERFTDVAAISNRLILRDDWRDPSVATGFADVRLRASRTCLAAGAPGVDVARLLAHLRDHGRDGLPVPGSGDDEFSICMHIRGVSNSTAGMVCELPRDPAAPARAWIALGSPCVSVFFPVFPFGDGVPAELADEKTWRRFAELRDRVERDDAEREPIRSVLDPVERELRAEADATGRTPSFDLVAAALDRLA